MIFNNNQDENFFDTIKALGIPEEQFYSLPCQCQRDLVNSYFKMIIAKNTSGNDLQLSSVTKSIDDVVKKKILTIFKKK